MILKDTLNIQELSLVGFANALGFYMVQNERGLRYFEDARGVLVSMSRMVEWHNGNIRGRGYWHMTFANVAQFISEVAKREITVQELTHAYTQRLVYEIKYKYSKKQAKWIKQYDSDNIVKYTEVGRASYGIK